MRTLAFSYDGTRVQGAGDPDGVGEQQCFVDLEGNASVIEVIHFEMGRCATTRTLSPAQPVPAQTKFELQPVDVGCIVTLTSEVELSVGQAFRPEAETERRRWASDYLQRVRRVLDDESAGRSFRT